MDGKHLLVLALFGVALSFLLAVSPRYGANSPDQLIERLTNEVLAGIRTNPKILAGDFAEIESLVDDVIFPHVDFERTTSLTVGRAWHSAKPEQRCELIALFRTLLLITYAGVLSEVRDEKETLKDQNQRSAENQ